MNDIGMELLAPAGDERALRAAVQNGADAVYLGAGAFNARRGAGNFDGDALDAAVRYCHARGVQVHVTLNTLVREDEFDALLQTVRAINRAGADAVIVQDFGVARALRRLAPDLRLHASTQMAVHNPQAAAFLRDNGFDRVVLARELDYAEIAACAREGVEVECFAHGALCVACSGQCLMSSLVGGRSGNRGMCAQPCRLPWRLEGVAREGEYALSTKDLCAIDQLARLRDAGARSLKLEGRLKRAEYVAVTVAAYRRALDALNEGRPYSPREDRAALAQMFNRGGFTRGYAPGVAEEELMYPARPNHIGALVGKCAEVGWIVLEADVLDADALALRRRGADDMPVKLSGRAGERVRCPRAARGDALFRLVSEAQMKRARETFEAERRQAPVSARATLRVGQPARLWVGDGEREAEAVGEVVQEATGRGLDAERAIAQLKKTGGTPWAVTDVALEADANAFCPVSVLNALRRDALARLEDARCAVARREGTYAREHVKGGKIGKPLLIAQSADPGQLVKALMAGADAAVFESRDLRPGALDAVSLPAEGRLGLAVPAVLDGEALRALNAWALRHGDRFEMTYLSNVGQLGLEWPGRRVGDFMLNVGNDAAVSQLMDWGMEAYTPSVELNAGQVARMGGEKQLVVWGRLPLMHLRHCPLRAAKGMKGRHADCRHCDACTPSERLDGRSLIDRKGAAFPLQRVAEPGGCVIQVLNSVPLMPLRKLERLPAAAAWRLLLSPDEPVEAVVKVCRAALDAEDFRALPEWEILDAMNTTAGHFFRGVE